MDADCAKVGTDRTLRIRWPDTRSKKGRYLLRLTGVEGVSEHIYFIALRFALLTGRQAGSASLRPRR